MWNSIHYRGEVCLAQIGLITVLSFRRSPQGFDLVVHVQIVQQTAADTGRKGLFLPAFRDEKALLDNLNPTIWQHRLYRTVQWQIKATINPIRTKVLPKS